MAIELEALIFPPEEKGETVRPIPERRSAEILRREITKVRDAKKPIGTPNASLVRISASEDGEIMPYEQRTYLMKRQKLQELVLRVMSEFGFDPDSHTEERESHKETDVQKRLKFLKVSTEYPSLTTRCLVFERTITYYRDRRHPTEFTWSVCNYKDSGAVGYSWNSRPWKEVLKEKLQRPRRTV